ncbi:MAG: reductive dehalogenase [Phycisphaerales bacterium]|nr:MAG: reductive dehalogenase [Phycisphaerales bacterium]
MDWIPIAGWVCFAVVSLTAVAFVITSLRERRWRPAGVAFTLFCPALALSAAALLVDFPAKPWIILAVVLAVFIGVVVVLVPTGPIPRLQIPGDPQRIDERDAIFHRFYRLKPGSPEFDEYYREHPDKTAFDEKVRSQAPLGYPGSRTYHSTTSPFQSAASDVLDRITREVDWTPEPVEGAPVELTAAESTRRIKGFAHYLGAKMVGTTKLNPAHVYSHIGRSPGEWGEPIELDHTHAVAIGVEMSFDMVRHAPDSTTITETAFKYFEAAKIAMIIARYINLLGYEARAHVDGNYRVLCVPVAVDAGLGELGRLGVLMTPRFGPRVRLSVVTTNLPLVQDEPVAIGVQHFCEFCKKCATCCPSGAVDSGDKAVHNGVEKWQTHQERCYRFWRVQGTDCALCMRVCPYAHPTTSLHNMVRRTLPRSAIARRLALLADDLFYGRRPTGPSALPEWHAKG